MESRYRGSLVGPLILIGLGVIFLLNNLGVLDWNIWRVVVRLWPLLLIAVGLDILLGRRSGAAAVLAPLAVLAILGFGLWLAWAQSWTINGGWVRQEVVQPLEGARRADVEIAFGAGRLRVAGLSGVDYLVSGRVDVAGDEQLERSFRRDGDTAVFRLREKRVTVGPFFDADGFNRTWDLGLATGVPMRLRLETGVGKSEIDLSLLNVYDLEVKTGVGEATLALPRRGQVEARVEGGIGQLTVVIPREVGARVRIEGGLGGIKVGDDFTRRGNEYTTANRDSAPDQMNLEIKGGIGHVVVEHRSDGE